MAERLGEDLSKSVLVTGSSGYIGKHAVNALKQYGAHVIALDHKANRQSSADEQIVADIFVDDFNLAEYCEAMPDCCLHLAWRNGFKHDDCSHIDDLSRHFAFISSLADKGVSQIAVMGSMHEVGYWEGPIDASTPCSPQSLYGIAKNALREALFVALKDSDIALQWLRGFYIFGDDENSQSIFGKILRASREGKRSFPFTSGQNMYDFISVYDLADMIARVVMQDEITGIINCCSGEPVTLAQAIETFIKDNDLDIVLDYGTFPDRPYDSPGVWGDATVIRGLMA